MKKLILITLLLFSALAVSTPTIKAEEPDEPQQTISDLEFSEQTALPDDITGFYSGEITLSENFDEFTLELPDTFYLTDSEGGVDTEIFFKDANGDDIRTRRFDPRSDNLIFTYDSDEVDHIRILVMVTYGDNPPSGGSFPDYLNENSAIQLGEAWQIRFHAFNDYLGSRGFITNPPRTSIEDFDVDYPEDETYYFSRWIDGETGEQVVWNKDYNRDIEVYAAFTTGSDPTDFFVPGVPGAAPDARDDAMMDNFIAVLNNYGFGDEIGMTIFYLMTLLILNMVVIGAKLGGAASIVITLGTTSVFMLTGLIAWWIAIFIFLSIGLTMIGLKGRMQYD